MQITTSAQAAARDNGAIAAGIDSWVLMHAAGSAAANFIITEFADLLPNGAVVYAGSGNNGGDAYVVAAILREAGIDVVVHVVGTPKTDDAKRAAELLRLTRASDVREPMNATADQRESNPQIIIDGVLGTGQRGELRDAEHAAAQAINSAGENGDVVVALDVPTGLNATTGEIAADAVRADITLAFGTVKRAHVLQREQVGEVVVVDIGLGEHANKEDGAWEFADPSMLAPLVPAITWDSHKGKRGRIAIVGGDHGMAGAIILASRAALHAGAGLVYAHVAKESVLPLQIGVPQAVTREWTQSPDHVHAAAIGPGFGRSAKSMRRLEAVIDATRGVPTVLDADALTLLATGGDNADAELDETIEHTAPGTHAISRLRAITANRAVVCTPHVGEFARLIGAPAAGTLEARIQQAQEFATSTGACILLKGTPTAIVSPDGSAPVIVARGTPVLATGGSGDLLTGIIGALLGQGASPRNAGAIGAWVHGRAAEIATGRAASVRGVTLDEVLVAMPAAWSELSSGVTLANPILAQLPAL